MQVFLEICNEVNFPVAIDKTGYGTQFITFLGMLLNTLEQTISITLDKRDKALQLLQEVLEAEKVTVIQLQRLAGLLNFLGKAIVPEGHLPDVFT